MELDITKMVTEDFDQMPCLSGSAFELGDNAGFLTWKNSRAYAQENPLLPSTLEAIQYAKDYFKDFGAWSAEEIAEWSDLDVQALVVQEVASQIREYEEFETWEDYEHAQERGTVSGNIYRADDHYYFLLSQ